MDVSVVPCSTYDLSQCRQALEQLLSPLGGLDWVRPGMRVGLKANLITFLKPDAAGTTHPVVLSALSELLTERGAEVIIGDSPGGLYNAAFVGPVPGMIGRNETRAIGAGGVEIHSVKAIGPAGQQNAVKAGVGQGLLNGCNMVHGKCLHCIVVSFDLIQYTTAAPPGQEGCASDHGPAATFAYRTIEQRHKEGRRPPPALGWG